MNLRDAPVSGAPSAASVAAPVVDELDEDLAPLREVRENALVCELTRRVDAQDALPIIPAGTGRDDGQSIRAMQTSGHDQATLSD